MIRAKMWEDKEAERRDKHETGSEFEEEDENLSFTGASDVIGAEMWEGMEIEKRNIYGAEAGSEAEV